MDLSTFILDLNKIVRPEFIVIALFLNALGAVLKYRTPFPTKLLPLVLLAIATTTCAVWGWFTSSFIGGARWVDTILMAGIVHGAVVASIAVFGWDAVFGLFKYGLSRKGKKMPKGGDA